MNTPVKKRARLKAFTLVEILIATSVASLLIAGLTTSFIMGLKMYHFNSGLIAVNKDMRDFTNELVQNATYANFFIIYPSFVERTRNFVTGGTTQVVDGRLNDGGSGDFLLLVYVTPAPPARITRIIGIYRGAPANVQGPVRSFTLNYGVTGTAAPLNSLLPAAATIDNHPEVVRLARGLSNNRMFYNFRDRSIMVQAELEQAGAGTKRATNTYNFTVSPRS